MSHSNKTIWNVTTLQWCRIRTKLYEMSQLYSDVAFEQNYEMSQLYSDVANVTVPFARNLQRVSEAVQVPKELAVAGLLGFVSTNFWRGGGGDCLIIKSRVSLKMSRMNHLKYARKNYHFRYRFIFLTIVSTIFSSLQFAHCKIVGSWKCNFAHSIQKALFLVPFLGSIRLLKVL